MDHSLLALTAPHEFGADELIDGWPVFSPAERVEAFRHARRTEAGGYFLALGAGDRASLLRGLAPDEARVWLRLLDPDEAADVLGLVPPSEREALLDLLDGSTRREVVALLAYAEDVAGGLMNPRFARLRPEMTADEAVRYLRRQARSRPGTLRYAYVLDAQRRPVGVVSLRDVLVAPAEACVSDLMDRSVVTVPDGLDQEEVAKLFRSHRYAALPVVDASGALCGVVTADDIIGVVEREATEDMHKLGGVGGALAAPYLRVGLWAMARQRGAWLVTLFLGEMLTATAMAHYEDEIARAVVLSLFVPLIISSGGNAGSQATTLVIRALALGEVRARDAAKVLRREAAVGLALGALLALVAIARVTLWQAAFGTYGEHYGRLAAAVGLSLVGVVAWGTIAGATLPFVLRALRLDPASASAPFVATLVDVSGLLIYFNVASLVLHGTLL